MSNAKFTFVNVPGKTSEFMKNKSVKELLMKWSLTNHISIQYYNFNEEFNSYQKQDFAEAFFKDTNVYCSLKKTYDGMNWFPVGAPMNNVIVEPVPCSILSLEFFDRIYDRNYNIVRDRRGDIIQCLEEQLEYNVIIADKLRVMLLDEEDNSYNLYTDSERNQFIFRLFKFICIGGQWCQYEDNVTPYIDTTKLFYKDLLRVERVHGTNELVVRSVVIKVVALNKDDQVPENNEHPQNFLYLIIDPFSRQVTTLYHHYGGAFGI